MGAHPWQYLVSYDPDLGKALAELREREFAAGRYNPAKPFPRFPVDPRRAPGAKHPSVDAARRAAGASGTRSILDMLGIGPKPQPGAVTPLDEDELADFFSTLEPARSNLEDDEALFEMIERGHGVSLVSASWSRSRKRVHDSEAMTAALAADRIVQHLERGGYVLLKRPPASGSAPLNPPPPAGRIRSPKT